MSKEQINEEYSVYVSSSADYFQAMLDDVKLTFFDNNQFEEWLAEYKLDPIEDGTYTNNKFYAHLVSPRKLTLT